MTGGLSSRAEPTPPYPGHMTDDEPERSNVDMRQRMVAIILVLVLVATMAPFLLSVIF
jgi:hypothetical protein